MKSVIIKLLIDRDRSPGNWFISGSQQFPIMKSISESLAGRAAILSLPTFAYSERKLQKELVPYLLESTYPEPLLYEKNQQPPPKEVVCKERPIGAYIVAKATKEESLFSRLSPLP
ncbi:MAG: hypothetical protein L3J12_00500 [Spirochaetales bacterium]|nr:hypothetical protein [Spirochaetales bacterium]